jgi:hypothetical protein
VPLSTLERVLRANAPFRSSKIHTSPDALILAKIFWDEKRAMTGEVVTLQLTLQFSISLYQIKTPPG